MAKAILVKEEREEALDQEAMILMIPGYLWNMLVRQAKAEGTTPGTVFSKAVEQYMKEHGAQDAVDYLWDVSKRNPTSL